MKQKVTRKNFYRLSLFRESLLWLLFSCAFGPRSKEKKTPLCCCLLFQTCSGTIEVCLSTRPVFILRSFWTRAALQTRYRISGRQKGWAKVHIYPHVSFTYTCIAATMLSHTKLRVCPMQGISSRTDDFSNMQFSYVFAAHHTCITY